MSKDNSTILANHERRIIALERLLQEKPARIKKAVNRKPLTEHIIVLREGGFFRSAKTAGEVYTALQKTYQCDKNRVEVALVRLADQRQLRRASKTVSEHKYQAYVW